MNDQHCFITALTVHYIVVASRRVIYESITGKFPPNFGKALSRRERDQKELSETDLVYSEIDFDALGT
jgi:hypothetical protein